MYIQMAINIHVLLLNVVLIKWHNRQEHYISKLQMHYVKSNWHSSVEHSGYMETHHDELTRLWLAAGVDLRLSERGR